jgi:penicillin amidase
MTRIFLTQELPAYEGTVPMTKVKDTVEVFTDQFGVPHVFANNEEDLFLAAGYIAARERLFQMSMVLNAVRGELASMLGDEYLSADIYLRTWRIHDISKKITEKMDLETKKIMEAFCQGINIWIDETRDNLPLEFRILGIKPQYWQPSDVVGYARMMAHELQSSWKAEIIYGAVAQFFGMNKLAEIYPGYSETQPTISEHLKKKRPKSFTTKF